MMKKRFAGFAMRAEKSNLLSFIIVFFSRVFSIA